VLAASAAALTPKDKAAVKASLVDAKTLQTAITGEKIGAARTVALSLGQCRARYQPTDPAKQDVMNQLFAFEVVRQLQHDGLADFAAFVAKVQKRAVADPRLRTARAALATELSIAQKVTAIPVRSCDDLATLAKADYTQPALQGIANDLDRRAGVTDALSNATDKKVNLSRPALVAAGLTKKNATLLLHAQTGELFLDVLSAQ
jgi:hypothetical protein